MVHMRMAVNDMPRTPRGWRHHALSSAVLAQNGNGWAIASLRQYAGGRSAGVRPRKDRPERPVLLSLVGLQDFLAQADAV